MKSLFVLVRKLLGIACVGNKRAFEVVDVAQAGLDEGRVTGVVAYRGLPLVAFSDGLHERCAYGGFVLKKRAEPGQKLKANPFQHDRADKGFVQQLAVGFDVGVKLTIGVGGHRVSSSELFAAYQGDCRALWQGEAAA